MKKEIITKEKYAKRLQQIKFLAEHFDEIPQECQTDIAARADTIVDIFIRKKVG